MTGHRSDVDRILAATDVFTTLSPVENCFAATILEAMTAQRPCVLTDVGYTSEAFGASFLRVPGAPARPGRRV